MQGRLDFEGLGCRVCVYIHIYIYTYICLRIHAIYMCIYLQHLRLITCCASHIYTCLYVCMYVCMHTRTHTHTRQGTPRPLEVGAAVEIHSLHKSPELNGVRGEVVESEDLSTGRCQVKTATGRILALKPVNLRLLSAQVCACVYVMCIYIYIGGCRLVRFRV